jgi:hypothetical protein
MSDTQCQLQKSAKNGAINNGLHLKEILHLGMMYTKSVLLGDALCILQSKSI